jgi:leader peptidase (prepilin peptidase)/N-methyltransferase
VGVAELLAASPAALIAVCALFGLVVGSFLNVVILRLPRMLENAWQSEARLVLEMPAEQGERLSLLRPASRCPHCGTPIAPWRNIPLLSWLLLRGRAACCGEPVSLQYPLVEAGAGALAAACAWRFGFGWELAAALILVFTLLAAAVIDWNTQLLPDTLTLPLLWLGLLLNVNGVFAPLSQAVIGAAAGYLALWSVFVLFKLVTGKEGMGYGDFKLLAVLGAWFGWPALPMLVLVASGSGAVVGIGMRISGRLAAGRAMPFGPFIAAAGVLWLLLPIPPALVAP